MNPDPGLCCQFDKNVKIVAEETKFSFLFCCGFNEFGSGSRILIQIESGLPEPVGAGVMSMSMTMTMTMNTDYDNDDYDYDDYDYDD